MADNTERARDSATDNLIERIEDEAFDTAMAARWLRSSALQLLDEVNRLEREHPETFPDFQGREWHIARYEVDR